MSDIFNEVSKDLTDQEAAPERGRPGHERSEEPQPGIDPGAGSPPTDSSDAPDHNT